MINALADMAHRTTENTLFYVQRNSASLHFSYRKARYAAAALARQLEKRGCGLGGCLACNMYNGAELALLSLAAAYGGFTLAILNPRLSFEERSLRMSELENATDVRGIDIAGEQMVNRLLIDATGYDCESLAMLAEDALPMTGVLSIEDYAQEREATFDGHDGGIVMFTSGSSGTPKATLLPWRTIIDAAQSANEVLSVPGHGVWQLVLPMCHIGGFQVMVRSIMNGSSFILYERYSATRILNDVLSFQVTHISVVDKILADLLEKDRDRVIQQYACILLGGAALNDKLVKTSVRAKANVYASYGMTETSSCIAVAPITRNFTGGLHVLPGYEVHVTRPDESGIGQLQVKGPGVFEGYLNARKAMSADGFFVTGDRASLDRSGMLHVYERTEDLIISGGENIYPAEIRDVLLGIPGVKDAYVFGTADETWGYRPVAFLEADYSAEAIAADHEAAGTNEQETGIYAATCPQEFARCVHRYLDSRMSNLHHPKHILVLPEFPRTGVGKVDRIALKQLYDKRIDVKSVALYRVKQPFVSSIKTSKATVKERESFFVEVTDWAGRTGIAECVSFASNWYLPETIDQDYRVVRDHIAPVVLNERYLHPSQVSYSLATFPQLAKYPMAKAAIEPAIWDLYGKIVAQPLSALIGGSGQEKVLGGAVVGLGTPEEVSAQVDTLVRAGYSRIKLKVNPQTVLDTVAAVRAKHKTTLLLLDANQSFTEADLDTLCKLDAYNITCIEEPLNPAYVPQSGETNLFRRLSLLQQEMKTPICLDESVVSAEHMQAAMSFDNLRCYAIKIAKFGGIQPALDFCEWVREQGKVAWMGGMFDTGVSKRMHAAFCTLPGMDIPGDISDYSAYFAQDCAMPALQLDNGELLLNSPAYGYGLGCELNHEYLQTISVDETVVVN